jgi:hypothetical protein
VTAREDVWRRVRALLERANHEGTPQAEAESALALAYRLMLKYDLDEREVTAAPSGGKRRRTDRIVSRTYRTSGPYRVRRNSLRLAVADAHSCACCRDFAQGDADTVVSVIFGTAADLDAHEVIYAAAELLAMRTIPWGDRGFRTSWFHGFEDGVWDKLMRERKKMAKANRGMELVLQDRLSRAVHAMESKMSNLRTTRPSGASWADAYHDGRQAGGRFSTGARGVEGGMPALPRGA